MRRLTFATLAFWLVSPPAFSFVTYDGADGVFSDLFNVHCVSCHSSSLSGAARGGAPTGVDFDNYSDATDGTNAADAVDQVTAGDMPPGGALSQSLQDLISEWENDSFRENAAPTVITNLQSSVTKTSATLNGAVDPNGLSVTDADFQWGPTGNVTANNTSNTSIGSGGDDTDVAYSRGISGLSCGTGYQFRARASNTDGQRFGTTRSFTTDACDPPIIRFTNNAVAGTSTTVNMSEDSDPTPFSLTLRATDADGGTLSWSIPSGPSDGAASFGGSPTANTTSGQNRSISYTPDPDFTGSDTFVVRVTDNTSLIDQITINVNIAAVADSPEITEGMTIGVTMDEDGSPMAFSLTLNATDGDGDTLTWNIDTPASNGVATASGTGNSKVIGYTPSMHFNGMDSFVVGVYDGAVGASNFDQITVDVTINPVNDPPVGVDDPNFEVPVVSTGNPLNVLANDINIDAANGDVLTISAVGTALGTVTINGTNTGLLYTPPPNFVGPPPTGQTSDTFTYTVRDVDNATDTATVTVMPLDTDDDTIVDFLDNCDNDVNTNQANNDNDAQGDVCDPDDDNDGMLDTDEAMFPACLDPFTDDAAGDCDNDGRSNGDEIAGGFDPTADDVPPGVTAANDLAVDATGFLTAVDLGESSSSDFLEGAISAVPRLNVNEAALNPCTTGELIGFTHAFRPGRHTVYWSAQDTSGNCAFDTQTLDVRPLASLEVDKFVEEGQTAQIAVTLNGDAPEYPVVVSYGIDGTADSADHDAVGGSINIASGTSGSLTVQTVGTDAAGEGDETVVVTLLGASNAALGRREHTLTIVEGNVPPEVTLQVTQGADSGPLVVQTDGTVIVTAMVVDANPGDTHTFNWAATDNALVDTDAAAETFSFDPTSVSEGVYTVAATVTDSPAGTTGLAQLLITVRATAPALAAVDTDGDGTNDDVEGFQDMDGDGIADHLDAADLPSNVLQTETQDPDETLLIEGEQGLVLRLGATARHALRDGGMVTGDDVQQVGGQAGAPVSNGVDEDIDNVGGLFDFEIAGLVPGATTRIVLPLRSAIRANATYRKFTSANGWQAFTVDDNNAVFSAPRRAEICPGPGDSSYRIGLTPFDECVQLQIEDGGPNDADGVADGIVRDPGGVGVVDITVASESTPSGSALRTTTLILLSLILLSTFAFGRNRQKRRRVTLGD